MGRNILAVIAGLLVGSVVNMGLIMLSWAIYPLPEGTTPNDPEAFAAYVKSLPAAALLIVLAAHAGGAFVGGFVASLIAKHSNVLLGAIVGGFFLAGGVMNLLMLPSPLWFSIADLVSYIPSAVLGAKLVAGRIDSSSEPST